jgi:hypothetical protein
MAANTARPRSLTEAAHAPETVPAAPDAPAQRVPGRPDVRTYSRLTVSEARAAAYLHACVDAKHAPSAREIADAAGLDGGARSGRRIRASVESKLGEIVAAARPRTDGFSTSITRRTSSADDQGRTSLLSRESALAGGIAVVGIEEEQQAIAAAQAELAGYGIASTVRSRAVATKWSRHLEQLQMTCRAFDTSDVDNPPGWIVTRLEAIDPSSATAAPTRSRHDPGSAEWIAASIAALGSPKAS